MIYFFRTMTQSLSLQDRIQGALYGMFIGDALAMPVHWYYDTNALQRDYGQVSHYLPPRNPHPDSILWRSSYNAPSPSTDIVHEQAQYWGRKGIHYHQFLRAGENTLNVKLARELLFYLQQSHSYSAESWLQRLVDFLTTRGNHNDTYVEEYLRHFFSSYAQNKPITACGRKDEKHIGGLSLMLPIVIFFAQDADYSKRLSLSHLALTHGGQAMHSWGKLISSALLDTLHGSSLKESISMAAEESRHAIDISLFESLADYPDITVVTRHFSSACYVDYAVPATIHLALKYQHTPEPGLIANTMCGGDNAGRGAVLGALLGAANGMSGWPSRWIKGLVHPPPDIVPPSTEEIQMRYKRTKENPV
jgi:ADP-ribosylglycohydrolase